MTDLTSDILNVQDSTISRSYESSVTHSRDLAAKGGFVTASRRLPTVGVLEDEQHQKQSNKKIPTWKNPGGVRYNVSKMAESHHQWMDSPLWLLYPLSVIWYVSSRKHDPGEVGKAKVQTAPPA